jgi:hypothetical protein
MAGLGAEHAGWLTYRVTQGVRAAYSWRSLECGLYELTEMAKGCKGDRMKKGSVYENVHGLVGETRADGHSPTLVRS